jgi:hypothetical protein
MVKTGPIDGGGAAFWSMIGKKAKPGMKPGFAEHAKNLRRSEAGLVQVAKQLSPDVDVRIGADDATVGHGEVGRPRQHLVAGRLTVRRVVPNRGPARGKGRRGKRSENSGQRNAGGEKFLH